VPWKSQAQTRISLVKRVRKMSKARKRIILAGFSLILVGIVCLVLSDKVVHSSWSQATLDAFGVGFIIGGVVDVLAISSLNSLMTDEMAKRDREERLNERVAEKIQDYNAEAQKLVDDVAKHGRLEDTARDADSLLKRSNGLMNRGLRIGLEDIVNHPKT
jgi:hypothetical protein